AFPSLSERRRAKPLPHAVSLASAPQADMRAMSVADSRMPFAAPLLQSLRNLSFPFVSFVILRAFVVKSVNREGLGRERNVRRDCGGIGRDGECGGIPSRDARVPVAGVGRVSAWARTRLFARRDADDPGGVRRIAAVRAARAARLRALARTGSG